MSESVGAEVLARVESGLVDWFGQVPVRASVSFLGVEPIEVLRFDRGEGEFWLVTLGMSRRPMASPEQVHVAATGPRAELMLRVDARTADAWRQLALLAAAPAVEGVVYSVGMSVDLGSPLAAGATATGVVVVESEIPAVDVDETGTSGVELLQVLPATPSELAWCRLKGSDALRELWRVQGTALPDLARTSARLE